MPYSNKRRLFALLIIAAMLLLLLPIQAFAAAQAQETAEFDGYIVKLRRTYSAAMRTMDTSVEALETVCAEKGIYLAQTREDLSKLTGYAVEYVEPNYRLKLLDFAPNDELYVRGEQWDHLNMNVPSAWAKGQYGAGVTVAVIDSGLYGVNGGEAHEDIDHSKVVKQYNFVDDNAVVTDEKGHGTFVAGQIFAAADNGKGVAGLMPEAKIMPLKVFGSDEAYTSDVISAIYYAIDNNAQVINLSLGGNESSQLLEDACKDAVRAGVLLVAAAGNSGTDELMYPAAYDCVIGVGAVTAENEHYSNSQYGQSVFVVAPGKRICGIKNETNTYCYRSGTSMAAPAVSALGAMAKSIDADITQSEFMDLLIRSCTDLGEDGFDSIFGCGLVDFGKAAQLLLDDQKHNYGKWESNGLYTHSRSCTEAGCTAKVTEEHLWEKIADICGERTFTCALCGQINTVPLNEAHYDDVAVDTWYHDAVHACTASGYFKGVTPTSFAPNAKMTRAMFVTVMYRMAGAPDVSGMSMPFNDVKADSWAYNAIIWAYNNGITKGISGTAFAPDAPISRAQLVTLLYRQEGSPTVNKHSTFADSRSFAEWSADAISWASGRGIVKGYEDNTFRPENKATRAEMATVIFRYKQ